METSSCSNCQQSLIYLSLFCTYAMAIWTMATVHYWQIKGIITQFQRCFFLPQRSFHVSDDLLTTNLSKFWSLSAQLTRFFSIPYLVVCFFGLQFSNTRQHLKCNLLFALIVHPSLLKEDNIIYFSSNLLFSLIGRFGLCLWDLSMLVMIFWRQKTQDNI